jgi:hypothetical protein
MKYLALQIPGVDGNFTPPSDIISTGGPNALANIITAGLNLTVLAATIVCLLILIWSGFDWLMSQGDKQKIANARQRLAFSIIGLFVVFTSFVLINIIYTFFNLGGNNFLGSR